MSAAPVVQAAPLAPTPLRAGSLATNPRLCDWLSIHADGTVSVRTGKVELGQGITTALAKIVAEELGIASSRIRLIAASTTSGPNEGMTAGSMSIAHSGAALRQVCAEARWIYLRAAAARLGLTGEAAAGLEVADGTIFSRMGGSAEPISYWQLADDALLDCEATGRVAPRPAGATQDTEQLARLDLPDKVTGRPRFLQDMTLPGTLYGRVAHPPSAGAQLVDVDLALVQAMPGVVATVRDGSFIGVIADDEYLAVKALHKLAFTARWAEQEGLPDMHDLPAFLRSQPSETSVVGEKKLDTAAAAVTEEPRSFEAAYSRPFLAHASIGPSCAIARHEGGTLEVWTHSQGIYNLRADLALVFGLTQTSVKLQHVEGAGCYGHNGADDAACDAALLARAVPGRAVHLQWTREDELGCAPFGAAMAVQMKAQVGADGRIIDWQHEVWSNGHSMRPGRSKTPVLQAATQLEKPFERQVAINVPLSNGGGAERNSVPCYDFAQWRAVCHRTLNMPIRTSSLRSLGAHCNVFAIESFLDEIAAGLGVDPLEFRLRHLSDPRGREVLESAARMAGWATRQKSEGKGIGLAFSRYKNIGAYCAVVASVDVTREARVEKIWIAVDVGRVVQHDGVVNQIEGGAIQTVSWVLKEAVQFDRTRILSNTWESYPILRFSEVPEVEINVMDRPAEKSMGAGEATHGPVAAAIANAVADALGVRVRSMPLSTENITRAALAEEA